MKASCARSSTQPGSTPWERTNTLRDAEQKSGQKFLADLKSALDLYASDHLVKNSVMQYPSNPFDALAQRPFHDDMTGEGWHFNGMSIVHVRNDGDYYEFVGDNQGAYQVSFTHVNQGEGTYLFRENRLYQFVGPLQGDYVPEIDLYLPTSHSLVGFDLKSEPVNGMQVFSEFAVSIFDIVVTIIALMTASKGQPYRYPLCIRFIH